MNKYLKCKEIVEAIRRARNRGLSPPLGASPINYWPLLPWLLRRPCYEKELSEIIARHLDVIEGVIEDKEVRMDVQKKVMALLDELSQYFQRCLFD